MSHPLLAVKRDTRIPESVVEKARALWDNNPQDVQCFVNVLILFLDHYDDPTRPSGTSAGAITDVTEYGTADVFAFGIALPVGDQLQFSVLRTAVTQTLVKRFYGGRVMFDQKHNRIQLQFACWRDASYHAAAATPMTPAVAAAPLLPRSRKRKRGCDETRLDDIGFTDPSALALFKEMIDALLGAKSSFQTMDYDFGHIDGVGYALVIRRFGDVQIEFLVEFYEHFKFHVDDIVFVEKDMWIVLKNDSTISFNTKF